MKNKYFVLLFILLTSLSANILYFHYRIIGSGDELLYEFFVKQIKNPDLLIYEWSHPKEFFSIINYRTFIIYIYYFFDYLFKNFGLDLFYFLNVFFLYLGVYILSNDIWKNKTTALLSVMLLHFGQFFHSLGGFIFSLSATGPGRVDHALFLFAIIFLLRKKYYLSIILTTIATLIHFATGMGFFLILYSFIIFLFIKKKISWIIMRNIIFVSIICALVIVITFLPLMKTTIKTNKSISSQEYFSILNKYWASYSYDHADKYVIFTFYLIIFMFLLSYRKTNNFIVDSFFSYSFIIICIIYILFYIFTQIYPLTMIMHFHLYRLMVLVNLYVCLYLANLIRIAIEYNKNYLLLFSSYLFFNYMVGIRREIFGFISILMSIVIIILVNINLKNNYFNKYKKINGLFFTPLIKLPLIIINYSSIFLFIHLQLKLIFSEKNRNKILITLFILLIVQGTYYLYLYYKSVEVNGDKYELYNFIKSNVPNDGEYLVPLSQDMADFRLRAERISFVDDKHFAPYFADKIKEQDERYTALLGDNATVKQRGNYDLLNEIMITKIKDKYSIKYAVFKKPKNLNYTILFENKEYILYNLD